MYVMLSVIFAKNNICVGATGAGGSSAAINVFTICGLLKMQQLQ